MADFSSLDALIIKNRLRTEQYDLKHLNGEPISITSYHTNIKICCSINIIKLMSIFNLFLEPDFVHSIDHEDYVYFFFRESAVEYINCGKVN